MEFGEYVGMSAIVVAIFLATAVYIWQSSRSDAGIGRLDARIDRLDARIDRLEAKIEQQGDRLSAEIREMGRRVSDSELEQARLNGVNSVLANQAHTH